MKPLQQHIDELDAELVKRSAAIDLVRDKARGDFNLFVTTTIQKEGELAGMRKAFAIVAEALEPAEPCKVVDSCNQMTAGAPQ